MSIKQIIKESIEKNPVGLKEALEEELRSRLALAIEAKMEEGLDEAFAVHRKGGSIGEVGKNSTPVKIHDTIEDAKAHAKRLNKQLSPGEKKHFGLGYHVKPIKEGYGVFEDLDEDYDQIDEISKGRLGSYVKKAYSDASAKKKAAANMFDKADNAPYRSREAYNAEKKGDQLSRKVRSRIKFADKAVDRLTK